MTTENIVLDAQRRGTEFKYDSALTAGWTEAMFTGGIVFTLRKRLPASSVVDDTDSDVVGQVSVADGGIVFTSPTEFTVTIPGSVTTSWPTRTLYWDMQGIVATGNRVLDIAAGTVLVVADVTRTQ
jgi:hypothetical protein